MRQIEHSDIQADSKKSFLGEAFREKHTSGSGHKHIKETFLYNSKLY